MAQREQCGRHMNDGTFRGCYCDRSVVEGEKWCARHIASDKRVATQRSKREQQNNSDDTLAEAASKVIGLHVRRDWGSADRFVCWFTRAELELIVAQSKGSPVNGAT